MLYFAFSSGAYSHDMIEFDHPTAAEFTNYISGHQHTLISYHYDFKFGAYKKSIGPSESI